MNVALLAGLFTVASLTEKTYRFMDLGIAGCYKRISAVGEIYRSYPPILAGEEGDISLVFWIWHAVVVRCFNQKGVDSLAKTLHVNCGQLRVGRCSVVPYGTFQ